jgi:signal peptidase II
MNKKLRILLIFSIIFLNIGCDQVSKKLVRNSLKYQERIELIPDYFILTNVENTGAFLGAGSDFSPILKLLFLLILPTVVLLLVLYYVLVNTKLSKEILIGLSFLVGGGIGNIYDRFLYGSVTDFFHISLGGIFKTGIFNMADVSVMVGMGFVLYSSLVKKEGLGL